MEVFIYLLSILAVPGIVYGIRRLSKAVAVKRATASVPGKIHSVRTEHDEGADMNFWRIIYIVDNMDYGFEQRAYFMRRKDMLLCVGETVTVHYDPKKPRIAWAETPGEHAYKNIKAKEYVKLCAKWRQ